jgi:hypothetical protein
VRPIVFSPEEGTLDELSGSKVKDENLLPPSGAIGKHGICGGQIEIHRISKAHNAIHCAICGLRFVIPEFVRTYFSLRWWFHGRLHEK